MNGTVYRISDYSMRNLFGRHSECTGPARELWTNRNGTGTMLWPSGTGKPRPEPRFHPALEDARP